METFFFLVVENLYWSGAPIDYFTPFLEGTHMEDILLFHGALHVGRCIHFVIL